VSRIPGVTKHWEAEQWLRTVGHDVPSSCEAVRICELSGERRVACFCTAIPYEAKAREAEQHHRPCRGFGDGG
jgi:hypothetical protein